MKTITAKGQAECPIECTMVTSSSGSSSNSSSNNSKIVTLPCDVNGQPDQEVCHLVLGNSISDGHPPTLRHQDTDYMDCRSQESMEDDISDDEDEEQPIVTAPSSSSSSSSSPTKSSNQKEEEQHQQQSITESALSTPIHATTSFVSKKTPKSILRKHNKHNNSNTSSNNNNNTNNKVKCILLDLQPQICDTISRADLTAQEVDRSWYCYLELERMAAAALDPYSERNTSHAGGCRGLERYTAAGSSRLEIHRVQVVAAVLREQDKQRQKTTDQDTSWFGRMVGNTSNDTTKIDRPERIAQAALALSQECQELAYRQGFNDEVEAHAGTNAVQRDVVVLNEPSLWKQMQALSDMMFLESVRKPKQGN